MIQRAAHGGIVDGRAVVFQITEYQTRLKIGQNSSSFRCRNCGVFSRLRRN